MTIDFKKFSGTGMTSDSSRLRLISFLEGEGISNKKVLEVMRLIPRHIFVDEAISSKAYDNTALPIGKSQTISHPLIVAKMTEILMSSNPKRVLEIGTGSGYQAAILSLLVEKVYTIERIELLHNKSKNIFKKIVQFKAIARFALPKIRAQLIKMQLILRTVREKVDVFHLLLQLVLKHKKKKQQQKHTTIHIA